MDLHYSQTENTSPENPLSFTTLWIYTILKRCGQALDWSSGFTTLWIYTILKPAYRCDYRAFCFTTLWIYTILKRIESGCRIR